MLELVQMLTSQLNGVDEKQAGGGAGLILKCVQDNVSGQDFSKLLEMVPGVGELVQQAPDEKSSGGGLLGAIGGLASAVGGDKFGQLGQLAALAGGFSKLGLSPEMVAQFLPIVTAFVQKKGGNEMLEMVQSVLKK